MKTVISNKRSSIIIDLQERGYDFDFVLDNGAITCVQDRSLTDTEGFEITEKHLIIDDSCLENTCVIYAVQLLDGNAKGILMASYYHGNHSKKGRAYES